LDSPSEHFNAPLVYVFHWDIAQSNEMEPTGVIEPEKGDGSACRVSYNRWTLHVSVKNYFAFHTDFVKKMALVIPARAAPTWPLTTFNFSRDQSTVSHLAPTVGDFSVRMQAILGNLADLRAEFEVLLQV
jgi:hypothetical protein